MILEHYEEVPLDYDPHFDYTEWRSGYLKPKGFWVSVRGEDDWYEWCSQNTDWVNNYCYRVTLAEDANILYLTNTDEMDAFHQRYAALDELGLALNLPSGINKCNENPNWDIVGQHYDGIIIAPYQWSRRMSPLWYYGWDCASGCIWNLKAIVSVEFSPEMSMS